MQSEKTLPMLQLLFEIDSYRYVLRERNDPKQFYDYVEKMRDYCNMYLQEQEISK